MGTATPALKILLTSVGRRVELVRHLLETIDRLPGLLDLIGTEINLRSPAAIALGSRVRLVPRVNDPKYAQAIRTICREEAVGLVLPLIDPDIDVLSRAAAEADWPVHTVFGSVGSAHAEVVSDKWATYEWLTGKGVATARSYLPAVHTCPWDDLSFPRFVKPRRGSGGVDTHKVISQSHLDAVVASIRDPIVQEFLPGDEITTDVLIGPGSSVLASVQRLRLVVRGGEVSVAKTVLDAEVTTAVDAVVESLRPRGPITVQGMYSDAGFRVTEINARMGGGLPLTVAAGVPVAELLARAFLGEMPTRRADYTVGMVMTRFDDSFFYLADDQ